MCEVASLRAGLAMCVGGLPGQGVDGGVPERVVLDRRATRTLARLLPKVDMGFR